MLDCQISESMVAEGCILKNCRIHHSVLGVRSRVEADSVIEDTLIMGSDFYQPFIERQSIIDDDFIPIGIGKKSIIRRVIVDKNARIGNYVKIINKDNVQEANREQQGFYIRSGIVVVLKNAIIPDNTVI